MHFKLEIFADSLEEFTPIISALGNIAPKLIAPVVELKPEKVKPTKPEKNIGPGPDTKTISSPDVKKEADIETKPTVKPDEKDNGNPGAFDLSTDEKVEEAKVELRKKASALNGAGFMDFTRKALASCGNASSITKMEPKYINGYWSKLILIENGQTDKI